VETTESSFRLRGPGEAQHVVAMLVDRLESGSTMVLIFDAARWYLDGFVAAPSLLLTEVVDAVAQHLQPGDGVMLVSNRTGEEPADRPDDELVWEELVGTAAARGVGLLDWWVLWGTTAFSIAEHAPTPASYDAPALDCECCRLEAEGRLGHPSQWQVQHLQRVRRSIDEHGFTVQAVSGNGGAPSWAYTIGFLELGHPEVIVFGLDPECAAAALRRLYDEILDGRHRPVGLEHPQTLAAADDEIRLLPVPQSAWDDDANHFAVAAAYYAALAWEPEARRAVQLVWAAPGGHFPWEPECPERFRVLQPILDPETRGGS
jgi:hypothetical protein